MTWLIKPAAVQEDLGELRKLLAQAAGWQLGLQELSGASFEEGDEDAPVVVDL